MNLGPILTPKSSELQILPRQRGEQIAPLPASTYGLFWAKSDLGVSGEELHMGWGRESTFSPPLFFFFVLFLLPDGFSQTRPNSQKSDGGWMGG